MSIRLFLVKFILDLEGNVEFTCYKVFILQRKTLRQIGVNHLPDLGGPHIEYLFITHHWYTSSDCVFKTCQNLGVTLQFFLIRASDIWTMPQVLDKVSIYGVKLKFTHFIQCQLQEKL